jgi:hypothetical protein
MLPVIVCAATFSGLPWTAWRSSGVTTAVFMTMAITWRWGRVWQSASRSTA